MSASEGAQNADRLLRNASTKLDKYGVDKKFQLFENISVYLEDDLESFFTRYEES